MFKKKLIERAHKTEAILIRFLYKNFIEFFEKKVINKIKIKLVLRLIKIEPTVSQSSNMLNDLEEDKRRDIIGGEWFKYNQWMKDPTLSECWARVHWQLNKEYYVRYSREYYKEVEKRVYMMRPDLMKKYYSHNN